MEGEASTSHDVNAYVTENIPRATPYLSIVHDVASGFDRVKNAKQQLALLRELCVYATAQHASMELFVPLVRVTRQCGDSDNDRKIFRTALYILAEMLQNDPTGEITDAARRDLWMMLQQQLNGQQLARAYVCWRTAAVLIDKLSSSDQLASFAADGLRGFQLPEKPTKWAKRSAKKGHEEQVALHSDADCSSAAYWLMIRRAGSFLRSYCSRRPSCRRFGGPAP